MPTAVIVDAVRTPQGRRNGALKDVHPVDLAALTLDALIQRTGLDPELIEDVVMGCVMQVGDQAVNVGRNAALAAGFPESTVGTTVDRQCGSSQQAAHFAAQGIMAGAYDLVIAAGVESMTRVPMWSNIPDREAVYGSRFRERYGLGDDGFIDQGLSARSSPRSGRSPGPSSTGWRSSPTAAPPRPRRRAASTTRSCPSACGATTVRRRSPPTRGSARARASRPSPP